MMHFISLVSNSSTEAIAKVTKDYEGRIRSLLRHWVAVVAVRIDNLR